MFALLRISVYLRLTRSFGTSAFTTVRILALDVQKHVGYGKY